MMQYTNAFGVAIDDDAEEVVISFKQNIPTFNDDSEDADNQSELVSVVMCASAAKALADSLNNALDHANSTKEKVAKKEKK